MQGAPQGNQFWKIRSTHGREKLFKTPELMWDAACEYFEWCDNNPFVQAEQARTQTKNKPTVGEEGIELQSNPLIDIPRIRPYTIQGLCLYLDANTKYFYDFADGLKGKTDNESKDFSEIITRIRDVIYNQKFSGAASGFFNSNIISRDLGLKDQSDITTNDKDINIATIQPILKTSNIPLASNESEITDAKDS